MVKKISILVSILASLSSCAINNSEDESCDIGVLASCQILYSSEEDITDCISERASSCSDFGSSFDDISADITDSKSYECNSSPDVKQRVEELGRSVKHKKPDDQEVIYVDPLHNPLVTDYVYYKVTYTIQGAINLAEPGTRIVICPSTDPYLTNLTISGSEKDGIEIVNIANGVEELAGLTLIEPLTEATLQPVVKISSALGVSIKGVTLRHSFTTKGAGVYFSSNRASESGDELLIQNSTISDNEAALGGAIYVEGRTGVILKDTKLSRNKAVSGGAIYVQENSTYWKTITLENSTLDENSALVSASAIRVGGDDTLVTSNTSITLGYSSSAGREITAIFLGGSAHFYAQNATWGEGEEENEGGDVYNEEHLVALLDAEGFEFSDFFDFELNTVIDAIDPELGWDEFDLEEIGLQLSISSIDVSVFSEEEIERLEEIITEEAVYDFSGENDVECNLSSSYQVCVEGEDL